MVHLHTHSWFSFGGGASSPAALVKTAAACGQMALALTDTHSVAGAVQFTQACHKAGLQPILGATVEVDGAPLVLLCADNQGYANLCDLLTLAHLDRLQPHLQFDQLQGHTQGLICLTGDRRGHLMTRLRQQRYGQARKFLASLDALFPSRLFVELVHHQRPGDGSMLRTLCALAEETGLPVVAANAIRHAMPGGYALYDALTCARLGLSVAEPHPHRPVNDQAHLCSEERMQALGFPAEALTNTQAIADLCHVDLLPDGVTPPQAHLPSDATPTNYLRDLCRRALPHRYARCDSQRRREAAEVLRKELTVIHALGLDEFFLVVREVVEFARSCGIRCSGRGSAANSLVAYLLGITEVDPITHHLLFERFLHEGRKGMPDIDVDFETHRRHEVLDWMAHRFGEDHTAMTANLVTFRLRLAIREMAKVLGYPLRLIDDLSKVLPHGSARRVREHRGEIAGVLGESPMLEVLLNLVEKLPGCPRHLSLHSGGMILSRAPLHTLSPIQTSANGVRQVQFAKDDVAALGLIKFDVLGLRTLSVVTEAVALLRTQTTSSAHSAQSETLLPAEPPPAEPPPAEPPPAEPPPAEPPPAEPPPACTLRAHSGLPDVGRLPPPDVDRLPPDDVETFKLIREGRTMSVFQIESPGQWNLLSRSRPKHFGDLVAQVALFRPGPLQGNMIHPYILRRRGLNKVTYPHPCLESVLRDTYGVVLYQEQVLGVAHAFAGLPLHEADEFRRLMSKFRDTQEMEGMRERFVQSAIERHAGTPHPVLPPLANRVFDMIAKFVGYGFCRSHAAAFARTVYQTAYLKAHHPAAYMAAVLEHKPGFYPMNSVLEEAKHCGVEVLPPDVLRSDVKYRLEKGAIRVPLTQIKGMSVERAAQLVLERATRPFHSLEDVYRRVALDSDLWDNLARSGALDAFGPRRKVLWQLGRLVRSWGPSGDAQSGSAQGALDLEVCPVDNLPALCPLTQAETTEWDFQTMDLTTGPHPVALHRPYLERLGALPIRHLLSQPEGRCALAAGVVISRQRPPTAKGMTFLLLEDETGRLPAALKPPDSEKYGRELRSPGLLVEGKLQGAGPGQVGNYRSVLIQRLWPLGKIVGRYDGGHGGHPGEMAR